MKVTYNWLKDFVDISLKPESLADKLTMAGLEVKAIEKFEDDSVFEIEITSNRPDWLSVIGIAREVAAVTGKKYSPQSIVHRKIEGRRTSDEGRLVINIEDKNACPFYSARIIRNVKVKSSPEWMAKRLRAIGLRSINNIVDISNYLLFTIGQPLHAFDLDKIVSGLAGERVNGLEIIVRRAQEAEEIITIDGVRRILNKDVLVISSAVNRHTGIPAHQHTGTPIAIAGIMGGKDTEVLESTRNILLESACFSPIVTRKASRALGVSSDSSYRFERSVDKSRILESSDFATKLIAEYAAGIAGKLFKAGSDKSPKKIITFTTRACSALLGQKAATAKTKSIFKALEFKVVAAKKDILKIEVPDFRQDVKSEIDLVEEVCRIAGYDTIPLTLPAVKLSQTSHDDIARTQESIREVLAGLGYNEVITYSLLSEEALGKTRLPLDAPSRLQNPLSREQEVLRPTLLPGLLQTLRFNLESGNKNCLFFEIGSCFYRDIESVLLGVITENSSLSDFKGTLELLFATLGVKEYAFSQKVIPYFKEGSGAGISILGAEIGAIGMLKDDVLREYKIGLAAAAVLEINLNKLKAFINFQKFYKSLPKFPLASRDLSLVLDEGMPYQKVIEAIKVSQAEHLENVGFKDVYRAEAIGKSKKSLTVTLEFRSPEKTLTDTEVNAQVEKIMHKLSQLLGASIR